VANREDPPDDRGARSHTGSPASSLPALCRAHRPRPRVDDARRRHDLGEHLRRLSGRVRVVTARWGRARSRLQLRLSASGAAAARAADIVHVNGVWAPELRQRRGRPSRARPVVKVPGHARPMGPGAKPLRRPWRGGSSASLREVRPLHASSQAEAESHPAHRRSRCTERVDTRGAFGLDAVRVPRRTSDRGVGGRPVLFMSPTREGLDQLWPPGRGARRRALLVIAGSVPAEVSRLGRRGSALWSIGFGT
jgi:hypothetical protein